MYILLSQFVVFFTYTTDFMSTPHLSSPDYLKGDTHSARMAALSPRDVISIRAAIRCGLEQLGEWRAPWLWEFAAFAQYSGNPEELLEAAVYFCALEGVRLDVPGKQFGSDLPTVPDRPDHRTTTTPGTSLGMRLRESYCCFPSNSSCTPYFVLFIVMPCSIQNFINYNRAFRRRFCLFCCSGRTADLLPLL